MVVLRLKAGNTFAVVLVKRETALAQLPVYIVVKKFLNKMLRKDIKEFVKC
jgi:hypothetical protein